METQMKTNAKKWIAPVLVLAGLGVAGAAIADRDDVRALKGAKITLVQAIQAAETAQGGQAYDAGIDDDSFKPEYEVSIVREDRSYDVRVDAVTGEVLGAREDNDD
jgi:uncharacterized membrane protein YkoI